MGKKKNTKKKASKTLNMRNGNRNVPPPIHTEVRKRHVMRYLNDKQASATVAAYTFQRGHLLNMFLSVGANNNAQRSWRLLGAVRIVSIKLWSTAQTEVGYDSASLEWIGPHIPPVVISDTGNSFRPIHLSVRPPKGSFAELWSVSEPTIGAGTETDPLFNVMVPCFTTMDVEFEAIWFQYPLGAPCQLIHPTTGAAFGSVAVPPLDQNPTSTTTVVGVWTPQGSIKLL